MEKKTLGKKAVAEGKFSPGSRLKQRFKGPIFAQGKTRVLPAGKKAVVEKKPVEKARPEKKMEAAKKTEPEKKAEPQKTVEAKKTEPEKKTVAITEKKVPAAKEKKERASHTATPERKKRAKIQARIAQKKRTKFMGRFGKPNVRRKSIEKWQKWRKPRGIDIRRGEHKGKRPNSGFGTPREIRGLHPSGFEEVRIASLNEIKGLKSGIAIRIQAGIGQKKRKQMITEAKQKGIHVLN